MPLSNLLSWTVNNLGPVTFGLLDPVTDVQSPDDLVSSHAVPVEDDELETDGVEGGCSSGGRRDAA